MRLIKLYVLSILFVGQINNISGQKIMHCPEKLLFPVAIEDVQKRFDLENEKDPPSKSSGLQEAWIVMSDRSNNPIYKDAKLGEVVGEAQFRDLFYVLDQKKGWVQIGQGEKEGVKVIKGKFEILGWMPKDHVLLWKSALQNQNNRIHLKGFLLNKARNFNLEDLENAKLHDSPESASEIGKLPLHEFYFIYKIQYDKLSNRHKRYLIGTNSKFNSLTTKYIIGWVDAQKIEKWDTRVALEPNFTKDGFEERKGTKNYRVAAVSACDVANQYSYGRVDYYDKKYILWDGDPIARPANQLGETNKRRLRGDYIRFPVFDQSDRCFRSGILAAPPKVNDNSNEILKTQSLLKNKVFNMSENINVCFLLEAIDEYGNNYKSAINKIHNDLIKKYPDKSIRYGAVTFKDEKEQDQDIVQIHDVTRNITDLQAKLDNTYWGRSGTNDDVVCSNYALSKAMNFIDFKKEHTNIVVQLGHKQDISKSRRRASKAPQYDIDLNELKEKFHDLRINWIVAKTKNEKSSNSQNFDDNTRTLMNEFQKEFWIDLKDDLARFSSATIPSPILPEVYETDLIEVKEFPHKLIFKKPSIGQNVSASELTGFLSAQLSEVIDRADSKNEKISKLGSSEFVGVFEDNNSDRWTPESISIFLEGLNAGKDNRSSDIDLKNLFSTVSDSRFYTQVFFAKQRNDQNHNPFSVVLFMPEEDLRMYVTQLKRLVDAYDGPKDLRREEMQKTLESMARAFSAEELSKGQVLNLDIESIMDLILGIEDRSALNIEKELSLNARLKDLDNSKKFPEAELDRLIESITSQVDYLEGILDERPSKYEFQYETSSNTYYWLPVNEMY